MTCRNIGICQVLGQYAKLEMLGLLCGIGVVGICEAYTEKAENEIFFIYQGDRVQSNND
jgi:hypothetical protein